MKLQEVIDGEKKKNPELTVNVSPEFLQDGVEICHHEFVIIQDGADKDHACLMVFGASRLTWVIHNMTKHTIKDFGDTKVLEWLST